jgi:hypothetical protein
MGLNPGHCSLKPVTDHLGCDTDDMAYGDFAGVGVGPMRKAGEATVAAAMTGITVMAAAKGAAAVVNVSGGGGVIAAAAAAGNEHDVHVLAQGTGTGIL